MRVSWGLIQRQIPILRDGGERKVIMLPCCVSQSMEMPRQKETIRSLRYLSVESWPRIVLGIEIICYGFS